MSNVVAVNSKQLIGVEEIKILKRSLWPTFSDAEVNYAVAICNQLQLNPLLNQIHFVQRNTKNGPVITPQTGIDGFRLIAERTGQYAGSDDAVFEQNEKTKLPVKATVTVYKLLGGQRCAFTATARWDEYNQASNSIWKKMPFGMLAKCAEALALRKAFPAELSALRTDEEMHQADGPSKAEQTQAKISPEPQHKDAIDAEFSEVDEEPPVSEQEPQEDPVCQCGTQMKKSKFGPEFYCPDWKNEETGPHPKVRS